MVSVYLCDDEPIWLERLSKAVDSYQVSSDWVLEIAYQSTSPTELLCFLREHPAEGNIYFLDINFKGAFSGLDLAGQIREIDSQAHIIFITSHDEMVMETFRLKLSVLDYIVKDEHPVTDRVRECLDHIEKSCHQKNERDSSLITIRVAGSIHTIPTYNIYYVESIKNKHTICMHLQSQLFYFPDSLTSLSKRLGDDFMQCHKTCLVNTRHMKELVSANRQIILDNGEEVFCSVRRWKEVLQRYTQR